jgi:lysophospholipase L1-like esterase
MNVTLPPPEVHRRIAGNASTSPAAGRFQWLKMPLSIAASLVVTVLLLEGTFALAGIGEQEFLRPDATAGVMHMEGKSVTWRKEGFSRSRFNSQGLQDIERSQTKPAKTFRIACVGDSYVEALQVDRNVNFLNLSEKQLNDGRKQNDRRFEVLNFGVASHNLGQIYLHLKDQALSYSPDLVIVPVRVDTTYQLLPDPKGGFLFARPTFYIADGGKLCQDNTVQQNWNRSPDAKRMRACEWLREHSRIWGVVGVCAERLAGWWMSKAGGPGPNGSNGSGGTTAANAGSAQIGGAPVATPAIAAIARDPMTRSVAPAGYNASADQKQDQAKVASAAFKDPAIAQMTSNEVACTSNFWPLAHALINAMNQQCKQHSAKLVLLRLPPAGGYGNPLESRLLQRSAQQLDIPLLDATETFHKARDGQRLFYDSHLNPSGHQLMADQIVSFLQKQALVP